MRALILVLLLMIAPIASAQQVTQQVAQNNMGQPFLRLYNPSPMYVSCFYRDQYNYYTFTISPHSVSTWYPVYGYFQWACQ